MDEDERRRARDREYYARTAERRRIQARASYWRHVDEKRAVMRGRDAGQKAAANRKDRLLLRQQGFGHYGWSCACCGEANLKFLTFDHPNNDGAAHKIELAGSYFNASSSTVLRKLRSLGWPDGVLVVLCWNCNSGRQYNGGICPHRE